MDDRVQVSDLSDLGFAVLIAPEGKHFGPRLSVDPSPVRCGTSVTAVGYLGLPVNCEIDWDREHFSVRMEFRVDGREASVLERRPEGSRRLTWPVFKVATAFDSGMSGGPIFDVRDGEPVIRGVICSNMAIGVDIAKGGGQEAWASEIWPILMTPYRFDLKFFEDNGDRISVNTILDLFREGFVIDRGDTVRNLLWEVDGGTVRAGWRGIPKSHVAPVG